MSRFFSFLLLALAVGLARPAAAADGIPARPEPFTFVTDQANLLSAADAKKLEGGLRKYADNTGTQVVVVTVPSLGGTNVADYARQLGTAWGVGQRDKNNGIVVLLSGKEHKMSIEAGSGLRSAITPELTQRVMNQDMAPAFKQGNYFAGLRKGLNTLMLAANPSSDPRKNNAAAAGAGAASATDATTTPNAMNTASTEPAATTPAYPEATPEPASSGGGLGIGSLLIGALVIGGGIWLVKRLFSRNNNNAAAQSPTPNFRGNGPVGGNQTPNFMGNQGNQGYPQGGNYGGGYGGQAPSSGPGIGGMLATGAAAAAGAYIGNRMSEGHDTSGSAAHNFDTGAAGAGLGGAGAVPPANAASDYFGTSNSGADAGPDYFSDTNSSDNSGDYFSGDSGSYDDMSSDDTGGGGFDSTDDNQGSW
ncbi:YgcG family protein [Hymenobacter sp. BT559]|uniref:TPM domain-containing protein n=1 Tax=Hymenobacter sp. BT559 TaxID=2795729 RepID=UPI0018ECE0F2|nr:TPM domain-containing protein [Hymenobacter sp. BT559]MBJ6144601.1 TPM domain-containing protein [Hymenobacter sp. BT559]